MKRAHRHAAQHRRAEEDRAEDPDHAADRGVALTLTTEEQRADAVANRIRDAFPRALRRSAG